VADDDRDGVNLYDLLSDGLDPAEVLARLPPRDRTALADAWAFWARPGQHWRPGVEFITMHEGGRGSGKSWAARSAIFDAANNPDRWGGHAVIAGPDPTAVDSDMLHGLSGIVSTGTHLAEAGLIPRFIYNPSKLRLVFDQPRGGGTGLTVMIRASSNPKGGHGPNVGLAWFDEFGVWWHDKVDPAGKNFWRAIRPAIRAGHPDSKVIITLTPSKSPEVRIMQANSERPECPACRADWLRRNGGKYIGEALKEPWRLPRSEQPTLHPLLNTRTTVSERLCPTCGTRVVAEVRTVFFDTRDNPMTDEPSRLRAAAELASGRTEARQTYAPRGEIDSSVEGALVKYDDIKHIPCDVAEDAPGGRGPLPDRWSLALARLGADEVVVVVDPAVTATDGSDETGVVASCSRHVGAGDDAREQVVGLQDWSVRPDEVDGAPSLVWAPRAYWLACLWGARRIVVETNQGGEEVLSAVRDLIAAPPSETAVMARLRGEFPDASDARLGALARRIAADARAVKVEHVHRRADKEARFEWYGRTASRGQQAVLCASWLGGPQHWSTSVAQITGHEPPRPGAPRAKPRKDRGDALVASAQVLLRVVETHRGEVVDAPAPGWMGKVGGRR
jgi:phage terminase large subunit-like protein